MKQLDPKAGPRAEIYAHFRSFAQPLFTLCAPVRVDVPRLQASGGLFGGLLWGVLSAANAVPELRQRIRVIDGDDVVVEHDRVDCTCTVARPDESFAFGYFPHDPDRTAFVAGLPARLDAAIAHPGLDRSQQDRDDMLYLSCVPWIELTTVQHALPSLDLDTVPRVLWGRVGADGRMTVCVTAHHSLVDGRHVARFIRALEALVGPPLGGA